MRKSASLVIASLLSGLVLPASAVQTLNSTSTAASRNTTAPLVGDAAYTPWNYQGIWSSFLGTPIGPHSFVTAAHTGGAVGSAFTFQNVTYTTTSFTDLPNSDIRVWNVNGTFPTYAPMYTGNADSTADVTVIGRGTAVGAEVRVNDPVNIGQTLLRGWQWGTDDHAQSYGPATIAGVATSTTYGQLLAFPFSPNKSTITGGDSGGGVFINDGGVWKLAGINFSVEGPYKFNGADAGETPFNAAIFDQRYLYLENNTGGFDQVTTDRAAFSYASRISNRAGEIQAAIVPEPGTGLLLAVAAMGFALRRRRGA